MIVSRTLQQRGIWHFVVPGDFTRSWGQSVFLPTTETSLDFLPQALQRELQGLWRLVQVSPGVAESPRSLASHVLLACFGHS